MKCPHDGTEMDHVSRHGVEIDHCPQCGGIWLDRGELDHLIEAVRPAIALENPDPAPPQPTRPQGAQTRVQTRSRAFKAERAKTAKRFEDRGKEPRPGTSQRFGGRYSGKEKLKDILEDIFDFD